MGIDTVQGEGNSCRYLSREAGDGGKASGSWRRCEARIRQSGLGKTVPWKAAAGAALGRGGGAQAL